jgi:hypothetical protein
LFASLFFDSSFNPSTDPFSALSSKEEEAKEATDNQNEAKTVCSLRALV